MLLVKSFFLFFLLCHFFIVNLYSQNVESTLQTINSIEKILFYDCKKYPTYESLRIAAINKQMKYSKILNNGDRYKVIGLPEDSNYYEKAVKIKLEKDKKEGWIMPYGLNDRSSLIPFFSEIRDENKDCIKTGFLKPGMNKQEVFVCCNVYKTKEYTRSAHRNDKYEQWGDEKNYLFFYNGELCLTNCNRMDDFYYKPYYTIKIDSVEINNKNIVDKQIFGNKYKDNLIEIEWDLNIHDLSFTLKNNSESTLKLVWDEMALINGSSERIIHKGIKYKNKDNEQPNSIVPKNSIYDDLVLPTNSLDFVTLSSSSYWTHTPIIYCNVYSPNDNEGINKLRKNKFALLFVIKNDTDTYEYTFNYTIENISFKVCYESEINKLKLSD